MTQPKELSASKEEILEHSVYFDNILLGALTRKQVSDDGIRCSSALCKNIENFAELAKKLSIIFFAKIQNCYGKI